MSGKNGEPWNIACRTQRSVFIDNACGITVASAGQLLFDEANNTCTADRIVACVNALAGVENPAVALAELRAACEDAIHNSQFVDAAIGDNSFGERLRHALAAFPPDVTP